jgi:hypothetical protein
MSSSDPSFSFFSTSTCTNIGEGFLPSSGFPRKGGLDGLQFNIGSTGEVCHFVGLVEVENGALGKWGNGQMGEWKQGSVMR